MHVVLKEIYDAVDDDELKNLISRLAARIVVRSKGDVAEPLANVSAIHMLGNYMAWMAQDICDREGVTVVQREDGHHEFRKETKH